LLGFGLGLLKLFQEEVEAASCNAVELAYDIWSGSKVLDTVKNWEWLMRRCLNLKFKWVVVHLKENEKADCVEQAVFGGQMDYHHHARLTVHGREVLARSIVEGRLSLYEATAEHRLSRQSAGKWVKRYREGGVAALVDRGSRPRHLRRPISSEDQERV
jgi:hypothetical protein